MNRLMQFVTLVGVGSVVLTGCGGAGVPLNDPTTDSRGQVAQIAETAAEVPTANETISETTSTEPQENQEEPQSPITRSKGWQSSLTIKSWPAQLNAQSEAQFEGVLKGYDKKQNKWVELSANINFKLKDKNGVDIFTTTQKSSKKGVFTFKVTVPGAKKDYRKAVIEFAGNSVYKPSDKWRVYYLK